MEMLIARLMGHGLSSSRMSAVSCQAGMTQPWPGKHNQAAEADLPIVEGGRQRN